MSTSVNRRALLRGAGVAGVAGATGLAVVGTAGSAAATTDASCPFAFGTWQVKVFDATGALLDQGVQVAFHRDGLLSGANGHGRAVIGSWRATGASTFTFFAHEQLFDPSTGAITGIANLSHDATVSSDGNTFTSKGTVTGHTLSGQTIFQQAANIAATRFTMS